MINLTDGTMASITERCTIAGRPLDEQQQKIIRAALAEMLYMSHCRCDTDIVLMYQRRLLSEGRAAYWLGVSRLKLRQMANEMAESYANLKSNLRTMSERNIP